jgi:hypothetical protein
MTLTDLQREILARVLKSSSKAPKGSRMDELRASLHIHYQLYQEEKDLEMVEVYQPLVNLVDQVESLEEVEKALH